MKHIHHKTAKGRRYVYFDTGLKDERGKKIFKRLPSERDPAFPRAYATACDERGRRAAVQHHRTFDWLVRAYEKSPEFRLKSPNTQRSYRNAFAKAAGLLRDAGGQSVALERIASDDVFAIRDRLMEGRGANQTVRSLSALFAWAVSRKHMPDNPAKGVELFGEGEHPPWPEGLVEEALLDARVRAPVGLLYFTGQRIGDVIRMQRTDIKDGRIVVRQQKRGKVLEVPISAELRQIIDELPMHGFTFLTHSGGKPYSPGGLRTAIQAWAKERGYKIVPHGLRKNAVNALLEAECSTAEVSAITGQTLQMVEHYAKLRNQTALGKAAILKLDAARQKRNKART